MYLNYTLTIFLNQLFLITSIVFFQKGPFPYFPLIHFNLANNIFVIWISFM